MSLTLLSNNIVGTLLFDVTASSQTFSSRPISMQTRHNAGHLDTDPFRRKLIKSATYQLNIFFFGTCVMRFR